MGIPQHVYYFDEIVKYTEDMGREDERHVKEGLTKDELELFDILKKDKSVISEIQIKELTDG